MTRTIVMAAAAVLFVAGCADDDGGSAESATITVTVVLPGQAIDDLVAGDCLVELPDASTARVEIVECELPHRAEVYATHDFEGRTFLGAGTLSDEAASRCAALYAVYAGEPIDPTTDQAFTEIVPSEASWADGDRHVACLALPPAGESAEGSIAVLPAPAPL
jgi:hypothetical protein